MRSVETYNEKKIMQSIKEQSIDRLNIIIKIIEMDGNNISMNEIIEIIKDTQKDIKNLRAH